MGGIMETAEQAANAAVEAGLKSGVAGDEAKPKCPGSSLACTVVMMAAASVIENLLFAEDAYSKADSITCEATNTCHTNSNNGGDSSLDGALSNNSSNNNGFEDPYSGNYTRHRKLLNKLKRTALPEAKERIADLKNKGYKLNPDGSVTTPNGKTLSSVAGMKSAGFDPADVKQIEDILKEAQKKHQSLLANLQEHDEEYGGGMGGGKAGNGYQPAKRSTASAFGLPSSRKVGGQDPSIQGLSKNYGEDKIGVASGHLFKYIHRAYERNKNKLQP